MKLKKNSMLLRGDLEEYERRLLDSRERFSKMSISPESYVAGINYEKFRIKQLEEAVEIIRGSIKEYESKQITLDNNIAG